MNRIVYNLMQTKSPPVIRRVGCIGNFITLFLIMQQYVAINYHGAMVDHTSFKCAPVKPEPLQPPITHILPSYTRA